MTRIIFYIVTILLLSMWLFTSCKKVDTRCYTCTFYTYQSGVLSDSSKVQHCNWTQDDANAFMTSNIVKKPTGELLMLTVCE